MPFEQRAALAQSLRRARPMLSDGDAVHLFEYRAGGCERIGRPSVIGLPDDEVIGAGGDGVGRRHRRASGRRDRCRAAGCRA